VDDRVATELDIKSTPNILNTFDETETYSLGTVWFLPPSPKPEENRGRLADGLCLGPAMGFVGALAFASVTVKT
jgi:hypothetical protein